jgi:DnaJ like chaperone protein
MSKYGKWIGAGLGWAFGGPLGAILGFAFGTFIDVSESDIITGTGKTTKGDFVASLLTLIAAVMKADGRVLKSELTYVKKYFLQAFGPETTKDAMLILRDILQRNIPVKDVCIQIRQKMDYSSRLQLLHFLFAIADADGRIDQSELNLIKEISFLLGISQMDIESIQNMFLKSTDWAYKILEVDATVSDEEVRKAFRKMAMKNHPDKVSYLGEEIKQKANEKFKKINEAYEAIKKERGIK